MKRMTIRVVLIAWVAGLLVVISPFRGRQLDIVPRVHAQEGCSVATLQGAYGFYRTGTTPVGPLAAVGIATFDGQGNTSARQTITRTESPLRSFRRSTATGPLPSRCRLRGEISNP
jgi:hypothetical protein